MALRVSMEMHVAELSHVSIHCVCARAYLGIVSFLLMG
jgi:hypothetical protein